MSSEVTEVPRAILDAGAEPALLGVQYSEVGTRKSRRGHLCLLSLRPLTTTLVSGGAWRQRLGGAEAQSCSAGRGGNLGWTPR